MDARRRSTAELVDGYVWGRGALDMKGGVAMLVARVPRRARGAVAERRCILALPSDEENGGDFGASSWPRSTPDAFDGAKHALGEFGGATHGSAASASIRSRSRRSRSAGCARRARHRAATARSACKGGAMRSSATSCARSTASSRRCTSSRSSASGSRRWPRELPRTQALLLRRLLDPRTADLAARALGPRGRRSSRVIRNTVSPTIVHGGDKINVIPSEIELQLDGRILPGRRPTT